MHTSNSTKSAPTYALNTNRLSDFEHVEKHPATCTALYLPLSSLEHEQNNSHPKAYMQLTAVSSASRKSGGNIR